MEATYQISGVRIRVESPLDFAPNTINPMGPFKQTQTARISE